eukprot:Skav201797  [mRNA]  locus=scaffold645:110495:121510:- [translate_table: standard]
MQAPSVPKKYTGCMGQWLRCAGWCLPDKELSGMLQEHAKHRSKRGAGEKWMFKQLLDVLEKNRSSMLAKNRSKISKVRLQHFGFPFLWHRLDFVRDGARTSEQLYGDGETTFYHILCLSTNWDSSEQLSGEDLLRKITFFLLLRQSTKFSKQLVMVQ